MLRINHRICILDAELQERFIRASGPGGQIMQGAQAAE